MTHINLKFSPEMEELILQGRKICTMRREQKGQIGDTFTIGTRIYRLVDVHTDRVGLICGWYHKLEGFESEESLLDALCGIYPYITEYQYLYTHWFAYVGDAE